ncbi:MAG TPA: OmpA family protein [Rhodospirillaceae bacterium]|nr:OmpA family protein [Rhodospirillaceae bacterium]
MVHAKNRQWGDLLHATTRIGLMFSVFLMTGCGSVGEAVNPVGWYRGARDWVSGTPDRQEQGDQNPQAKGDFPNVPNDKRPVVLSGQQREDFSKGLAADRANAQYTQETIRREGTPTRPLSPEAMVAKPALPPVPAEPAASPSVVSQPAAVANVPAPALAQPELPPPPPPPPAPRPVPSAVTPPPPPPPPPPVRAEAPMPAPAPAPAPIVAPAPVIAPPPAPVAVAPATLPSNSLGVSPVAAPVTQAPSAPLSVDEIYRRRLSESNAASPQPAPIAAAPRSALAPMASAGTDAVTLVSPAQAKKASRVAGIQSLAAFDAGRSAASFQVGSVAFGEGTIELVPASRAGLRQVADLFREKPGVIRIIGRSDSARLDVDSVANRDANRHLAAGRAEAVGLELVRLGVPARKIYAGAAADAGRASLIAGSLTTPDLTDIYIDY